MPDSATEKAEAVHGPPPVRRAPAWLPAALAAAALLAAAAAGSSGPRLLMACAAGWACAPLLARPAALLLALAPDRGRPVRGRHAAPSPTGPGPVAQALAGAVPYGPLLLAALAAGWSARAGAVPAADAALAATVVALVVGRQYAASRGNRALLAEVERREAELRHRAFHDGLTGLANRTLFSARVDEAIAEHARSGTPLAVMFCDLDDFKVVNDTLGHHAGDELLIKVTERLTAVLRAGDTLARLGGDEFAVLLLGGDDPVPVGHRIVEALRAPFRLGPDGADRAQVGTSVGIAQVGADEPTPHASALLSNADVAMYAAKRSGKNDLRVWAPGMSLTEADDLSYRDALAEAVAAREIRTSYQAIVDVATGQVAGAEALATWSHAGEQVPANVFVPVAERHGLMSALTDLMLDRACSQISDWDAQFPGRNLFVSVNVSPQQITDPDFPARVLALLEEYAVGHDRLVLEITETAILTDPRTAADVAGRLRALGIRLALDDFGTGYSSLAHMHHLPLDTIKIDRAFVDRIDAGGSQERFARAVLALGRDLGLSVVAEGVERPAQLARLRELGCAYAQGFLFSGATGAAATAALIGGGVPAARPPLPARPAALRASAAPPLPVPAQRPGPAAASRTA